MRAHWTPDLPKLRAAMAADGALLPANPVADGKWHQCDPDPDVPSGCYWLGPLTPLVALYRPRGGEIAAWQPDDRRLPLVVRDHLASAAASCPKEQLQTDDRPRPPTLPPVRRGRSRRGDVKVWLQQVLAMGSIPTVRIFALAETRGYSQATVRRAACELGVGKRRHGFGGSGAWHWCPTVDMVRP